MVYSPVLSILTAILEIAIIIWALTWGKRNKIIYVSCAILLLLSLYQILEVMVCLNQSDSLLFARLGFLVITWLPVLGLLLICFLFPYRSSFLLRFVQLMMLSAFLLNIWIISSSGFLEATVCKIVFAQYAKMQPQFLIYGGYYQLGLLSMLVMSTLGIIQTDDHRKRLKLGLILLGSTVFIFPAMLLVIIFPPAQGALTSALCHFALFLALALAALLVVEKKDLQKDS